MQKKSGFTNHTLFVCRNETRLGGRFKMKTVIWYNMKDFERFFDSCSSILLSGDESQDFKVREDFNRCLCQFSISDDDIVRYMEEIMIKLAHQFDSIETSLDYIEENSILASENDSNDCTMGIDMTGEVHDSVGELTTDKPNIEVTKEDNKSIHSFISNSDNFDHSKADDCVKMNFSIKTIQEQGDDSYLETNTKTLLEKNPPTFRDIDLDIKNTSLESDAIHSYQTSVLVRNKNNKESGLDGPLHAAGVCIGDTFPEKTNFIENKQVYKSVVDGSLDLKSDAKACNTEQNLITCRNSKVGRHENIRKICNDYSKQDVYFTRLAKRKVKIKTEQVSVSIKEGNKTECNRDEIGRKHASKDKMIQPIIPKRDDENKELDIELQNPNSNASSYSCSVCNKTFCKRKVLYRHYRRHNGGEFCCLLCGAFHENYSQLTDHMTTHGKRSKLFCQK